MAKGFKLRWLCRTASQSQSEQQDGSQRSLSERTGQGSLWAESDWRQGFSMKRSKPKIDPLGPENKLIFMTGPVNGTMIPAASRTAICAKSPYTGSFFHSIFGGYFWARS